MNSPAIFLDRDGTLIEDRGYLSDPAQVVFFADTVPALRQLQKHFLLFIVTNQSGVSEGVIRREEADRVNAHVVECLQQEGITIREVYCCPHAREDGCLCIKPKPYFPLRASVNHRVDLRQSFVVGDHPCDVELAINAGARGVYVLTGHGQRHRQELNVSCNIVEGIAEATDTILAARGAEILRSGGLVAFPTETVYGLGADARNVSAVRRIFEVKGRPQNHPLIVHLARESELGEWAAEVPERAERLAQLFWPGPLTLVVKRSGQVPDEVTGGLDTVALRVPAHPLAQRLLSEFGGGIAAPSANRFGRVSPTTAAHVAEDLGSDVNFVLDGGACDVGLESTIVDFSTPSPAILRHGGVTREALEEALNIELTYREHGEVRCPGRHESHYAPRAQVILAGETDIYRHVAFHRSRGLRVAVMSRQSCDDLPSYVIRVPFSPTMPDMARELYAKLRQVDDLQADVVIAVLPPLAGLGAAVADRLRRAAGPPPGLVNSDTDGAGREMPERRASR